MRHAPRIGFAALLLLLPLRTTAAPTDAERLAAEVISREHEWAKAMQNRDASALDQILHPHFRLVVAYAPIPPVQRPAWLESTMRDLTIRDVSIKQPHARISQGVAVVTMWMELDWQDRERGVLPPLYHLTDTWKFESGRWQALSRVSQLPDQAIRSIFDAGATAWNRGDLAGYLASYCAGDETLWVSDGVSVKGKKAISAAFHSRFRTPAAMGRLEAEDVKIEFVNPSQAMVYGRWVQTLGDSRRTGTFTTRFRRTPGGWCAVEDRATSDPAAR